MFQLAHTERGHRGFAMTFENGWTVSVQWGAPNYCDNMKYDWPHLFGQTPNSSPDAEVRATHEDGAVYDFGTDTVKGWLTPKQVMQFMTMIEAKE